jgi:hypothetical protein
MTRNGAPMELTLSAAALATGRGKSTLLRAVKSGKLSARRSDDGTYLVDASELARVYPVQALTRADGAPWRATDAADGVADGAAGAELAALRVKVALLEDQLGRERETVDDLRQRLDRSDERVRLLTFQPERSQAPPASGGFLRRLLGW